MRASVRLVALHLVGGRLGELRLRLEPVDLAAAARARLTERRHRLGVLALLEEHPRAVVRRRHRTRIVGVELVQAALRSFDVPGLELGVDPLRRLRGGPGRRRQSNCHQHGDRAPATSRKPPAAHFTSSS